MEREDIELLAPAGSFEALKAAVQNGANAIYLGGQKFGARAFAHNFDDEALKQAVDYCHLRNVKLYVTVNTLIRINKLKILYLIFNIYRNQCGCVNYSRHGTLPFN